MEKEVRYDDCGRFGSADIVRVLRYPLLCKETAAGRRLLRRMGAGRKKVRVADRNRSHYPYHAVLKIDGMVCANCARRVENAINRMDGYWAEADVAGARANVHCKKKPDLGQLKEAVRAGGYTVLSAECAEDARHAG